MRAACRACTIQATAVATASAALTLAPRARCCRASIGRARADAKSARPVRRGEVADIRDAGAALVRSDGGGPGVGRLHAMPARMHVRGLHLPVNWWGRRRGVRP